MISELRSILLPRLRTVLCTAGLLLLPPLGLSAAGLQMPDVPVTGGKKATLTKEGQVLSVTPMPGLEPPRTITWAELTKTYFNLSHTLPSPRAQELVSVRGSFHKSIGSTVDLLSAMKRLTIKDFSEPKYGAKEPWVQSFGNIVAEFRKAKGNARRTEELLTQLSGSYPAIFREVSPYLEQLVRDDFLYSAKWDPYKDESVKGLQNDGILFVDHWILQADKSRDPLWSENLGEHKVYQGAAILYADVNTIKEMEKNYAKYFEQVGQNYLEVYPIQGSHLRGLDKNGNEWIRSQIFLRNDLPFPYGTCSYTMNVLEYFTTDGHLVSDYYSDDKDDLNWMAGRDTYLPIRTTTGDLVGNMIVTNLDFDIKNLPERDIDRIVSMKAGLGNMKRISERLLDRKEGAQANR